MNSEVKYTGMNKIIKYVLDHILNYLKLKEEYTHAIYCNTCQITTITEYQRRVKYLEMCILEEKAKQKKVEEL
jgi:hypothetical protein